MLAFNALAPSLTKKLQCIHTDQQLARVIEKGYIGASSHEG